LKLAQAIARRERETGSTWLLALVRMGMGTLLLNEARLATSQLNAWYFGSVYHWPFLPESLVPSQSVYWCLLALQWILGAAVLAGRFARPALAGSAAIIVYTMLCDRLFFHNYRHTMAAFAVILAASPCDRHLVLGREEDSRGGRAEASPVWAQRLLALQVSIMYLASGGSKLLDAEWRGGQMMGRMMAAFGRLMVARGMPAGLATLLAEPAASSLVAKAAIATELSLAFALWVPKTRRAAMWVGLVFHVSISFLTPVAIFTAMMLLAYLAFVTPDEQGRTLVIDPRRPLQRRLSKAVKLADVLRRFEVREERGRGFTVVERDGKSRTGPGAAATLAGCILPVFPLWPIFALASAVAALARRRLGPSDD
jgi:HTTM domain